MWEYIQAVYTQFIDSVQRLMNALIEYSQNLLRAAYGLLVLTFGHALKLTSDIFIGALILAITLPSILLISFAIAYIHAQRDGFWYGLVTGLTSVAGLLGITALISAGAVTLYAVLNYESLLFGPFNGLTIGWNGNMHDIHEAFLNIFRWNVPVNLDRANFDFQFRPLNEIFAGDVMDNLNNFRRNMEQGTMNDAQIDAMALSEAEMTPLINEQVRLSDNDIQQLETAGEADQTIKDTLEKWKNTKNRLDNDVCPITLDRPARENTIVLIKQYEQNGQWLAVPNGVTIFDKEAFKMSCRNSARHPMNIDDFYLNPTKYTLNGAEYPTRYRFHNYYTLDIEQGISQELNQLGQQLQEQLVRAPAARPQTPPAAENVVPAAQDEHLDDEGKAVVQRGMSALLQAIQPSQQKNASPLPNVTAFPGTLFNASAQQPVPQNVSDSIHTDQKDSTDTNSAKAKRNAWLDKHFKNPESSSNDAVNEENENKENTMSNKQ